MFRHFRKISLFVLIIFNIAIHEPYLISAKSTNTNKSSQGDKVDNEIKAIIWDLNGTLIGVDEWKSMRQIGLSSFLKFIMFDRQDPRKLKTNLKKEAFNFLNSIYQSKAKANCLTPDGDKMPDLMVDWQKGIIDGHDALNLIELSINDPRCAHCFKSETHKNLIGKISRIMFNPKKLASKIYNIKPMVKLLKEVALQKNQNGKFKYKLYVLSNFDNLTFNEFIKTHEAQKVFRYFYKENVVISAHVGLVKPQPEIYAYFLNKYNLKPQNCIFIDDQKENIDAAQKIGIKSLIIQNKDYTGLRDQLMSLGVLG